MYQVRYTENALQDLEAIFSYIAMDNLDRALSFAMELKEHLDGVLSVFPNGGTLYNPDKGVRKHSYKGHTAFYHVPDAEHVEVLHVINLRRPLTARGIEI